MMPLKDKNELMTALATRHGEWMTLVARVPLDQMAGARIENDWTLKDIIAHVAAYELWTAIQIEAATRGERTMVEVDEPRACLPAHTDDDQDARNEQIYAHNRRRALPDVMSDSGQGFAALMGAVAAAPDALLADPQATDWTGGQSLLQVVAINSYGHYDDHIPAIRAWLDGHESDFEVV